MTAAYCPCSVSVTDGSSWVLGVSFRLSFPFHLFNSWPIGKSVNMNLLNAAEHSVNSFMFSTDRRWFLVIPRVVASRRIISGCARQFWHFFFSMFFWCGQYHFPSRRNDRGSSENSFIRTCGGWPHAAAVDCSPFIFPWPRVLFFILFFFFLGIYLISESFVVDGYCPLEDDTRRCIFLGCYFYFFELKTSSVLVTASYLPAGLPSGLIDHTYRPEVAVSFFFLSVSVSGSWQQVASAPRSKFGGFLQEDPGVKVTKKSPDLFTCSSYLSRRQETPHLPFLPWEKWISYFHLSGPQSKTST